jgi:hypothetical protein
MPRANRYLTLKPVQNGQAVQPVISLKPVALRSSRFEAGTRIQNFDALRVIVAAISTGFSKR